MAQFIPILPENFPETPFSRNLASGNFQNFDIPSTNGGLYPGAANRLNQASAFGQLPVNPTANFRGNQPLTMDGIFGPGQTSFGQPVNLPQYLQGAATRPYTLPNTGSLPNVDNINLDLLTTDAGRGLLPQTGLLDQDSAAVTDPNSSKLKLLGENGVLIPGLNALANIGSAYAALQQIGLEKDAFNFNKGLTRTNLFNQSQITNSQIEDKERARLVQQGRDGNSLTASVQAASNPRKIRGTL